MLTGYGRKSKNVWSTLLAACLLFGLASAATAEPSKSEKQQVPGFYRMRVGKTLVTVLSDGFITVPKNFLYNVTPEEMETLLARMFIEGDIPSAVNAYLIDTGSKQVLVDSGAGTILGPILGFLPENLKAAGYALEDIDAVVLTHCHRDHAGGLLDAKDKPVFPNATIYLNKVENDFWHNKAEEAKAEERFKGYFALVQKTAPIYAAKGRWKTFNVGEAPIPGVPEIKTVATYGHTAGMTAYELTSDGKKFLIWGDITHVSALQMPKPAVTIAYDYFPDRAASTRAAVLEAAAADKTLVAGIHLSFPGIGHVRKDAVGSYSWVPADFAPLPAAK